MRVWVLWIGKTRLPGIAALTEEYGKRLAHYCEFHGEQVRAGRSGAAPSAEEQALRARAGDSYRVALDPAGQKWDSQRFAQLLKELQEGRRRDLSFCIAGAEGFSPAFRDQADLSLSLSPLTLPHELARVVLLEQLYRAFALLAHHPYPR